MIRHARVVLPIAGLLVTVWMAPAIAQNGTRAGGGAAGPAPIGAAGPATLGAPGRQPANPVGPSGAGAAGAPSVDGSVGAGSDPTGERNITVEPAPQPPAPPVDQPSAGADNPTSQVLPGGGDGSEVHNPAGSVLPGGGSEPSP